MGQLESLAYKCPNCNADLKFNAEKQRFTCDYCSSSFTEAEMKEIAHKEEQFASQVTAEQEAAQSEFENGTAIYHCDSCGAEIMADQNTAATFCYYCHNPVILKGRVDGQYRPSFVLPFQISHDKAIETFKDWCKGRWFLPGDFTSAGQQEKLVGLYVPFWVTDVDLNGEMDALGKHIKTWSDSKYRYTETKEFAVSRKAKIVIKGLPADGASHIEDELMEAVEPFNYNDVRPFAMQYLSGFYAEKYDMDYAAMFPRIQKRAVQASDQLLRSSMVGYNTLSVTRSDIKVMSTHWEYMLLPVWFMTYQYAGKTYEFAINGQSGKFVGTPPLSKARVAAFCAGIFLLTAIIAFLLGGVL